MKPVMQTRVGEEGNCLSACIASLLEVPIEEIDLSCALNPDTWFEQLNAYNILLTAMTLWLGAAFYGYGFTLAVLITLVTALGILDYKLNQLENETFMLQ